MSTCHTALVVVSLVLASAPAGLAQEPATDSAVVVATAAEFHAALSAGDSVAALDLLSEDVVVVESGTIETLQEYRAHHLPADIEFAQAVPSSRHVIEVRVMGNVAWLVSSSTATGSFRGRTINSAGAELMVLSKNAGKWHIRAIHWSSRRRR